MKQESKPKTEVTSTTKVKLTIKGQSFDLTMDELKDLHEKIKKVVGEDNPTPSEIFKRLSDEAAKRQRPFYPPQWPSYSSPPAPYLDPSTRPMCSTTGETPKWMREAFAGDPSLFSTSAVISL